MLCFTISCGPSDPQESVAIAANPTATPVTPVIHQEIKKENGKDTAYFVDRITNLASLAVDYPNEKVILRSNGKAENDPQVADFLIKTETIENTTWKVIADEEGPGCISRIWFNDPLQGNIRIFLDQQEKPVIAASLANFFGGQYQMFIQPFVFNSQVVPNGGNISYFPIPFTKHCRILTDSLSHNSKYQISFRILSQDTTVHTYTPEMSTNLASVIANATGQISVSALARFIDTPKRTTSQKIPPQSRTLVQNVIGPAAIDFMEIQLDDYDLDVVSKIRLEIFWDAMNEPAVSCSLKDIFDDAGLQSGWNFYPLGHFNEEKYKCYYTQFYMPFKEKAQIFITNSTKKEISFRMNYHVSTDPVPESFLYFYAKETERTAPIGYFLFHVRFYRKRESCWDEMDNRRTTSCNPFLLPGRLKLFL